MNGESKWEDVRQIGCRVCDDYIAIPLGLDVRGAMSRLIAEAARTDNVATLFATDDGGVLMGAIDLRDLIRARSTDSLEGLISPCSSFFAGELVDDCLDRLRETEEDLIPVVDDGGVLIGVLTAQILGELIEESLEEDYAMLGGISPQEDPEEPLRRSVGKRLPWLIILLGLGLLVSGVIGLFDGVVSRLSLIVSFQSLILGMAGNVGTQSLAVTIRALTEEERSGKQMLRLVLKETRVGLCNGLILGTVSFLLIGAYLVLKGEAAALAFSVSLCTGLALAVSMLLASASGTAIPLLLRRVGIDPAVASGPFITTLNDLVAVVTYYGLSWLLLLRGLGLSA